jgi:predicted GIY-YIG superfamily endonuclease
MYYVYELINLHGTVEYVGYSSRPKVRFYQHTRKKPNPKYPHGKFYGRQDISMHVVAQVATKKEALDAEEALQIFWGLSTDRARYIGEKSYSAILNTNQVLEIKKLLLQNISCKEISIRFGVHQKLISNIKIGRNWKHL